MAYTALFLALLVGGGSLVVFAWFLWAGAPNLVRLGLGEPAALGLDAGLCLAFFVQHSGMVRRSCRQWMERFIPGEYGGAVYTIASGVPLIALVVLWQESPRMLASADGLLRWSLRAIFLVALVGFAWSVRSLKCFDPFGIAPIRQRLRGAAVESPPFTVQGPYRWVRHPLYFFSLLLIWFNPDLTPDRLLFNVLWTVWIVVGTVLEERDLVAAFGDRYREHQRKVPMLIPYRGIR